MSEQYALLSEHEGGEGPVGDDFDGVKYYGHGRCTNSLTYRVIHEPWSAVSESLPTWVLLLCIISIISTSTNLLLVQGGSGPNTIVRPRSSRAVRLARNALLPRPNIYIGLEKTNTSISRMALPQQLEVFPHVFAPISMAEPSRVFPTDGRARISKKLINFGHLDSRNQKTTNSFQWACLAWRAPYYHQPACLPHLTLPGSLPLTYINVQTSMVIQIRTQDHNLERCSFVSDIPKLADLAPQNRTLLLKGQGTTLQIWELDSSRGELDLTTLSWTTRPRRIVFLFDLVVQQGRQTRTPDFDCGASGSLKTYEFACGGGEGCAIDFWQEQPEKRPRMGEN